MKDREKFTLIELLVIVGIIFVLIAMLLPALAKSKEKTRRVNCMSNLKKLGLSIQTYASDFEDMFPSGDNALGLNKLLVEGYEKDLYGFVCPTTKAVPGSGSTLLDANLDYVYKGSFSEKDCGMETGMMCDRIQTPNHTKYGNVLFGDGHVTGFIGPDWATIDSSHNVGTWPADPH